MFSSGYTSDLRELSNRQGVRVPADPVWGSKVTQLRGQVGQLTSTTAPMVYPELGRAVIFPLADQDIRSSTGRRWQPETEHDSPHRWDYKFSVLNRELWHRMRIALLAARETGELQRGFTLADLRKKVECRGWLRP